LRRLHFLPRPGPCRGFPVLHVSLPTRPQRLNDMNATKQPPSKLEPSGDFVDPRGQRGFQLAAWPLCNGTHAPPTGASDLYERRCLEFLARYYQLNLLNQRLLAARQKKGSQAKTRSILSQIARVTDALEKLEDRYAPIGFFGEPVMDGVFYRDITFVRPELPRIFPSMQSSHIAIPGLEEIPQSELRGPAKIFRFGHGKVDL
jgi:hypothetical protein